MLRERPIWSKVSLYWTFRLADVEGDSEKVVVTLVFDNWTGSVSTHRVFVLLTASRLNLFCHTSVQKWLRGLTYRPRQTEHITCVFFAVEVLARVWKSSNESRFGGRLATTPIFHSVALTFSAIRCQTEKHRSKSARTPC